MFETIKTNIAEMVSGPPVVTATPSQPKWDPVKKMKCLIWNGKFNMEYVEHARPCIVDPRDVLLKITATTICGSDLHLYKGTFPGMKMGDIQGHEFMGIIEETGTEVKKFKVGQRVVVAFNIACGDCDYCKREQYTACDRTNPSQVVEQLYNDRPAAFYGYSHLTGGVPGGHAEYVRVAFADVNCFEVPDDIPDDKALYLTDIIPTALFGAENGEVKEGSIVGIWGLGPIGLMCAKWCQLMGAKKIIGIDAVHERLQIARTYLGIDTLDFLEHKGQVAQVVRDIAGAPLDVAIECAGFDFTQSWLHKIEQTLGMKFKIKKKIFLGLETDTAEIFDQMIKAVRKFGNISILGVYSGYANHFPIGAMMEKALTVRGGQCPCQKYMKKCIEKLRSGEIDPSFVVTHHGTLKDGAEYFHKMAAHEDGCIKVFMRPENYTDTKNVFH